MMRPIRIGLLAEGEAELGASIPYVKPEDGGKVIDRTHEGALHTLIRRELNAAGFPDCEFIQRHPTLREGSKGKVRSGYSILESKYLRQVVSVWKPHEIDMIVLVVDADNILEERDRKLKEALKIIQNNHLDRNQNEVYDRSLTGLAIRDVETWLIADIDTLSKLLNIQIEPLNDPENLIQTKGFLDKAIRKSDYLTYGIEDNQRPLRIRWTIAEQLNLEMLKTQCPVGYGTFAKNLITTSQITKRYIDSL
jgi:hypothetical protein